MLESVVGKSKAIDRAMAGKELTFDDGMELMNYDNIHMLGAAAEYSRQKLVGDDEFTDLFFKKIEYFFYRFNDIKNGINDK